MNIPDRRARFRDRAREGRGPLSHRAHRRLHLFHRGARLLGIRGQGLRDLCIFLIGVLQQSDEDREMLDDLVVARREQANLILRATMHTNGQISLREGREGCLELGKGPEAPREY